MLNASPGAELNRTVLHGHDPNDRSGVEVIVMELADGTTSLYVPSASRVVNLPAEQATRLGCTLAPALPATITLTVHDHRGHVAVPLRVDYGHALPLDVAAGFHSALRTRDDPCLAWPPPPRPIPKAG